MKREPVPEPSRVIFILGAFLVAILALAGFILLFAYPVSWVWLTLVDGIWRLSGENTLVFVLLITSAPIVTAPVIGAVLLAIRALIRRG